MRPTRHFGRLPVPENQRLDHFTTVRLSEADHAEITQQAAERGVSVSQEVRRAIADGQQIPGLVARVEALSSRLDDIAAGVQWLVDWAIAQGQEAA